MHHELVLPLKLLTTHCTLDLFVALVVRVDHVLLNRIGRSESFTAQFTQVRTFVGMNALMNGKIALFPERFVTDGAPQYVGGVGFGRLAVHSRHVAHHGGFLRKAHVAEVARKRSLVCVSSFVLYEVRFPGAHFTAGAASESMTVVLVM